jgi:hypothetical protein
MSYTIESAIEALQNGASIQDIAKETGWPVIDDCLVPEPGTWHADDGNAEIEMEADSGGEAAQEYVDGGEWGDRSETSWISVWAWREGIDADGEFVAVGRDKYKITLEAEEPECKDGFEHDWQSPLSIVGGCKENPGVYGSGGGVTIREVCLHCGCKKVTDTWAQDPTDGEQGLTSIDYTEREYESEVQKLLARHVNFRVEASVDNKARALVIASIDYRGIEASATYEVEANSEGYSENLSDTDTWPGPDGWPEPPQSDIDEARELIEEPESEDAQ